MKWNEIDFEVQEAVKANGIKLYKDSFKPTNSLEWWSVVASVR